METSIELFGTKRVMFGGHRPISLLARRVAHPYAAYEEMAEGLSEAERDAVFLRRGGSGAGSIERRFAVPNQP
jgi:predicted TIM-barrel fold metal-dependent hydrolase